jgi:hypothetical protein
VEQAMKFGTRMIFALSLMVTLVTPSVAADKAIEDSVCTRAYDLMQKGDFVGANRLLKTMVGGQSSNLIARRYFCYVLLQQGKIEEASKQIRTIAKLGAHSAFDYWLYAQHYIGAGQRFTGQLCLTRAFGGNNSPEMLSFLKRYALQVERDCLPRSTNKRETGNDPKKLPDTPRATKAGA